MEVFYLAVPTCYTFVHMIIGRRGDQYRKQRCCMKTGSFVKLQDGSIATVATVRASKTGSVTVT